MKRFIYFLFAISLPALVLSGCKDDNTDGVPSYTVTFDSQGGTAVPAQKVSEGGKVTKPGEPTREGYVFGGWYKQAGGQTEWNFTSDVVTADITLYAGWIPEGAVHTVTFDSNGGTSVEPQKVADGGTVKRPLPPVKSGEAFDDWYSDKALGKVYNFDTRVTSDMTLYAGWKTIDRDALVELIQQAYDFSRSRYTAESYQNMMEKAESAQSVIDDPSATQDKIEQAYKALIEAINALVEVPNRPAERIELSPAPVDGIIYVVPGEWFDLWAYAATANGDEASDDRVVFSCSGLEAWATDEPEVTDNSLSFQARQNLNPGNTLNLEIRSAEVLSVVRSVTLQVIDISDLKTRFINIVATLPSPAMIDYSHYNTLRDADAIYQSLPYDDRDDPQVRQAYDILRECWYAYEDLPSRVKFSFTGNTASLYGMWGDEEVYLGDFTYSSAGTFPVGTWSQIDWTTDPEEDYQEPYYQIRLVLNSDGTYIDQYRTARTSDGGGASDWEEEGNGTYTYEGSQSSGGILYLEWIDDYEPSVPEPGYGRIAPGASRR